MSGSSALNEQKTWLSLGAFVDIAYGDSTNAVIIEDNPQTPTLFRLEDNPYADSIEVGK